MKFILLAFALAGSIAFGASAQDTICLGTLPDQTERTASLYSLAAEIDALGPRLKAAHTEAAIADIQRELAELDQERKAQTLAGIREFDAYFAACGTLRPRGPSL